MTQNIKTQMIKLVVISLLSIIGFHAQGQSIDSVLQKYNNHSVPYIQVEELAAHYEEYVILDTRKKEEFEVSHLPGAIWVGEKFANPVPANKDQKIVVYCTIGVRSEDYGEQLRQAGFKNTFNLYGSIFAWKDAGQPLVDTANKTTEKVHTYNKEWSRFLKTGVKIYKK